MKVKNTSNKVIGFGKDYVLPGTTAEIDDSFEKNPTMALYVKKGYIKIVEKAATSTKK